MFGMNGGLAGFPGGRQLPKQMTHNCVHCRAKNILTI
jgi:hypothetical protein